MDSDATCGEGGGDDLASLRSLIDQLPNHVSIRDRRGRFVLVNRTFAAVFECTPDEFLEQQDQLMPAAYAPGEHASMLEQVAELVDTGVPTRAERILNTPNGRFAYDVRRSRLDGPGREPLVLSVATDITDFWQQAHEIRRHSALVEALPDSLFVLDRSCRFVEYRGRPDSPDLVASPPQFIGRSLGEFLPEVAALAADAVESTLTTGEVVSAEYPHTFPDGRTEHYEARFAPGGDPDEAIVLVRNVTERKRTEQELVVSNRRMRAILETAADGIITLDADGSILSFNPAAEQMFGWTAAEVIGRNVSILMPEPHESSHDRHICAYLDDAGEKMSRVGGRVEGKRHDGTAFPLDLTVSTVTLGGRAVFTGILRDATDRSEAERTLREARDGAEDASHTKTAFVANMSHEIRTPMNGVIGMTELLMGTGLDGEQSEYVETIRDSAESLLTVINDVLDFSKIEAGKLQIERVPFDLVDLVNRTALVLRLPADRKGLHFEIVIDDQAPAAVVGDPGRVRQILTNFVSNAIKFTASGRITIELDVLQLTSESCRVRLSVIDTGMGIPLGKQSGIFDAFTQADSSTTRRFGGTGLGLAISRQLAELMDGNVGLESELGEGSSFWLELPLGLGEVPAAPARAAGPAESSLDASLGLHVLLAEDNLVNVKVATRILEKLGCSVDVANNGLEAVDAMRSGSRYDVVLMDCQMPVLDGYEAARDIRGEEHPGEHVPIFALTANAMSEDIERCRDAGMDGHVSKPFSAADLVGVLGELTPRTS